MKCGGVEGMRKRYMKKYLMLVAVCCLSVLFMHGCGTGRPDPEEEAKRESARREMEQSVVNETEEETGQREASANLYDTEAVVTKVFGALEIQIPESWDDGKDTSEDGEFYYYYDDGLMLMVQSKSGCAFESIGAMSEEDKVLSKDAVFDGMKSQFTSCDTILSDFDVVSGDVEAFRYKADVVLLGKSYYLDAFVFFEDYISYIVSILVEHGSSKDYQAEMESLKETIRVEKGEASSVSKQPQSEVDALAEQLRDTLIEMAADTEVSAANDKANYLIVTDVSEIISRLSPDEIEESEILKAYMKAVGYLIRNHESDTPYGRAGELGFLLIRYVALDDGSGKQQVLEEFGSLPDAKDISEAGQMPSEETESESEEQSEERASTRTPTTGERNALSRAKDYLSVMPFSWEGLVGQLEYEKYSHEEAVYAADHCGADWNEQAVKKAEAYLDIMSFSRQGLIDQLEYEGFTHDQAVYGAEQNGY